VLGNLVLGNLENRARKREILTFFHLRNRWCV
jgi:hypothetical protein